MDLSLQEAARLLNVSESTLSRWIGEDGLPAFMINGRYRLNRIDLLEWAGHRRLQAPALYAPSEDTPAPPLHELLEGNVHYGVAGVDMRSVMAAVAERLPLLSARDKVLAAQALADREAKSSTIVADGIAIPHVRGPLIFGVDRPLATLCFLEKPVPFGDAGLFPVSVVWTLVTPTIKVHLAMLAKIASSLHDAPFVDLLNRRAPEPELLARLRSLA